MAAASSSVDLIDDPSHHGNIKLCLEHIFDIKYVQNSPIEAFRALDSFHLSTCQKEFLKIFMDLDLHLIDDDQLDANIHESLKSIYDENSKICTDELKDLCHVLMKKYLSIIVIKNFLDGIVSKVEITSLNNMLITNELDKLLDSSDEEDAVTFNPELVQKLYNNEKSAFIFKEVDDLAMDVYEDSMKNIEPLQDTVELSPTCSLSKLGIVKSIYHSTAIVYTISNQKFIVKESTDLFNDKREYVGKIYEIFGNIKCPIYVVQLSKNKVNSDDFVNSDIYYQDDKSGLMYIHNENDIDNSLPTDASWME